MRPALGGAEGSLESDLEVLVSGAGIDYGLGRTNIDTETGIRYGVISQHSVGQAWYDEAEADYGSPTCPACGTDAVEYDVEKHGEYEKGDGGCTDYACTHCEATIDSSNAFGDEPTGWYVDSDGYKLTDCLDSDIMIIKSPFYTFAMFCSPCVPGAGNLDSPAEDGAKTFCLGHEWFEDGKAPYSVYSVETNKLVSP
jgi:hypothetical protein